MPSKRVLALIQRSGKGGHTTDNTPVVVWDHELEILAEVHGTMPEVIDDGGEVLVDQTVKVGIDNVPKVDSTGKVTDIVKVRVPRSELVMRRVRELGLGRLFDGDPQEEYARLEAIYGLHPEQKVPYVEKIYGRFSSGAFTARLGVVALEDLPMHEIRTRAKEMGLEVAAKDTKETLIANIRALQDAGLTQEAA